VVRGRVQLPFLLVFGLAGRHLRGGREGGREGRREGEKKREILT